MEDLTASSRDTVTDRDTSRSVTPSGSAGGGRDGRDTHPIGGVTLSRPLAPAVEPLPDEGQAWNRGRGKSLHRNRVSAFVRDCDDAALRRAAARRGVTLPALARWWLQTLAAAEREAEG